MVQTELVDEHVSLAQCSKAVNALCARELKKKEKFEEGQLLPAREQNLWLNVTVKTIPTGHRLKPVKMCVSEICNKDQESKCNFCVDLSYTPLSTHERARYV